MIIEDNPLEDGELGTAGESALQRISDAAGQSLILILSDINMPGKSGLELLPRAKAARPDVPVIMITAYGDDATKRKALDGGAYALLTKPIDFAALRGKIDSRVAKAAWRTSATLFGLWLLWIIRVVLTVVR
jgi:CheY-like chemotaxis protein